MLTNPPVPNNFCVGDPISHLLTVVCGVNAHFAYCLNSVLNVEAVVAAFNQEKALVRAFSVIVQLHQLIDLRH